MKANEFVKIFGLDEAKRIVNYRDKHASRTHVYKFNKSCADKAKLSGGAYLYTESYGDWSVSVDELKRLVESHELVESYGGLDKLHEFAVSVWRSNKDDPFIPKAKQTIADVESCQ